MGASHTIAGIVGTIGCFALAVTSSLVMDTVGADVSDVTTALWIYTPYVDPGDRVAASMLLKGGDDIAVDDVEGSIDGRSVSVETTSKDIVRPRKRFSMAKATLGIRATVPADLPSGSHRLTFRTEGHCAGPDHSNACKKVTLESTIEVGATAVHRSLAALRALLAALVVWFGVRKLWRPFTAWAKRGEKQAGFILPAIILGLVCWCAAGSPLFARPMAAAVSMPSDVLILPSMVAWAALGLVAVYQTRRRGKAAGPASTGMIRFAVETELEAVENAGGYREAGAQVAPRRKRSLDEVARAIREKHRIGLRRSGARLVPRLFWSAPVTFSASDPEDIVPSGLGVEGDFGYVLIFAVTLADAMGPLDLDLDGTTVRVEKGMSSVTIGRQLRDKSTRAS